MEAFLELEIDDVEGIAEKIPTKSEDEVLAYIQRRPPKATGLLSHIGAATEDEGLARILRRQPNTKFLLTA